MHYYMLNQTQRRVSDGIHWNTDAVRFQVNVFLTHFCLSRQLKLPGNISTSLLGMFSRKNSLETIFVYKHFNKKFFI